MLNIKTSSHSLTGQIWQDNSFLFIFWIININTFESICRWKINFWFKEFHATFGCHLYSVGERFCETLQIELDFSIYSKASRHTALRSTDIGDTRFLICSQNTWDAQVLAKSLEDTYYFLVKKNMPIYFIEY